MIPPLLAPVAGRTPRPFLRPVCLLSLALLLAGTAATAGATPASGTTVASAPASAADIDAARQELAAAKADLTALTAERARLFAGQPHLSPQHTEAQRQEYIAALAAWKQQLADLDAKIRLAKQRVANAETKLSKLTGKPPPPMIG